MSRGCAPQLRAEAANSAQLLELEREKAAARAQEAAAARQELTASTAQHRQALDEERARGAALASEMATARIEMQTQAVLLRKVSDETGQLRAGGSREGRTIARTGARENDRPRAGGRGRATRADHKHGATSSSARRGTARSAALAGERATARTEIEMQAAQLRKTSEVEIEGMEAKAEQLKQAEAAKSAQSLGRSKRRPPPSPRRSARRARR